MELLQRLHSRVEHYTGLITLIDADNLPGAASVMKKTDLIEDEQEREVAKADYAEIKETVKQSIKDKLAAVNAQINSIQ